MKKIAIVGLIAALLFGIVSSFYIERPKTVLLAILAKDKAHVLPKFLKHIDNLDYDKKSIVVYVNTNNNSDDSQYILEDWIQKHQGEYKFIDYESHTVQQQPTTNPHEWPNERLKILANIRQKSLNKALEHNCDYYFVIDCDAFIIPETLKTLVEKDKPIIAPILYPLPPDKSNVYSNFFPDITENGYYKHSPDYYSIFHRQKVGTFKVPVVHVAYLINSKYIPKLSYSDNTDDYEFIIFCRSARENGIDQYICNEKPFGTQVAVSATTTLEEEKALIAPYLETLDP